MNQPKRNVNFEKKYNLWFPLLIIFIVLFQFLLIFIINTLQHLINSNAYEKCVQAFEAILCIQQARIIEM